MLQRRWPRAATTFTATGHVRCDDRGGRDERRITSARARSSWKKGDCAWEGRQSYLDPTAGRCLIGRPALDRPGLSAGRPAQSAAPRKTHGHHHRHPIDKASKVANGTGGQLLMAKRSNKSKARSNRNSATTTTCTPPPPHQRRQHAHVELIHPSAHKNPTDSAPGQKAPLQHAHPVRHGHTLTHHHHLRSELQGGRGG